MRATFAATIQADRERRRLAHSKRTQKATPDQLAKLDELTDRVIAGLMDEVLALTRDLSSVQSRARRPHY